MIPSAHLSGSYGAREQDLSEDFHVSGRETHADRDTGALPSFRSARSDFSSRCFQYLRVIMSLGINNWCVRKTFASASTFVTVQLSLLIHLLCSLLSQAD